MNGDQLAALGALVIGIGCIIFAVVPLFVFAFRVITRFWGIGA